ncbi:MAG: hypothetical protein EOO51_05845 [Flavobacterium sp.]|nr:MAG: hypothetical protein EOO51_05845 [Flavobacterium sp.]
MLHKTKIGVCIDDSVAYLLEEKNEQNVITIIQAGENDPATKFLSDEDEPLGDKQSQRHIFFKRIFDAVRDFDKIAFLGPANARKEIMNRIRANKLLHIEFQNIPESDKITESQKIEFISNYFGN